MSDLGSEVRREVNAGIATVSRMMERLETRDSNSTPSLSHIEDGSNDSNNRRLSDNTEGDSLLKDNQTTTSCAAGSSSN